MKLTVPREEFSKITIDLLKQGRTIRFQAFGNSMFPAIRSGDILRIEPCLAEPNPGEIVFFKSSGGKMTAHRLLSKIEENGEVFYKAKGDFFTWGCDFFPRQNLMGKVVAVEKRAKFSIRSLQKFQEFPFYPLLARIFFSFFPVNYKIVPYDDYYQN